MSDLLRRRLRRAGGGIEQRYAAIPKLIDTVGAPSFIDTGLTPATTDDPVGFVLNRAAGADYVGGELTGLGPELVTNGGFDQDSDWDKGADWSVANGAAEKTVGSADGTLSQDLDIDPSKSYAVSFTAEVTEGALIARFGSNSTPGNLVTILSGGGSIEYSYVTSPNTDGGVHFRAYANTAATIDNISVREIPGPQAIAPNASAKPRLEADGSLFFNGSTSQLDIAAPLGGFPADCDIFSIWKTDDNQFVSYAGNSSTLHGFVLADGSSDAPTSTGASVWVDGSSVTTRGEIASALNGSQFGIVEERGADLSLWPDLKISGYSASWEVNGHMGGFVIYDNANGQLTDQQRADIRAKMMQGLT